MSCEPSRALVRIQAEVRTFLDLTKSGALESFKRAVLYEKMAEVVFAYWAAKLMHPTAIYDAKREKRILARLRESRGDWGLLCYAIDGAMRDEYLMGRDQRATRKYDGIETIFRDRAQVERLAELCPKFRAGTVHPLVAKYTPEVHGNGNGTTHP